MIITNTDFEIKKEEVLLGEEKVLVKQYLPTRGKSDLIEAIQEFCFGEHIIDQPKMDALFNAFIVLNYSDIEFKWDEVEEVLEFYDYLESQNYITLIIDAIPEIEYNALIGYYEDTVNDFNRYKVSSTAMFMSLVEFGPALMEKIGEMSKEIDLDAIKLVADISSKMN